MARRLASEHTRLVSSCAAQTSRRRSRVMLRPSVKETAAGCFRSAASHSSAERHVSSAPNNPAWRRSSFVAFAAVAIEAAHCEPTVGVGPSSDAHPASPMVTAQSEARTSTARPIQRGRTQRVCKGRLRHGLAALSRWARRAPAATFVVQHAAVHFSGSRVHLVAVRVSDDQSNKGCRTG